MWHTEHPAWVLYILVRPILLCRSCCYGLLRHVAMICTFVFMQVQQIQIDSDSVTNLKTMFISMQRQPLSTTFLVTLWGFGDHLLIYLNCKSCTAAPCLCSDRCT